MYRASTSYMDHQNRRNEKHNQKENDVDETSDFMVFLHNTLETIVVNCNTSNNNVNVAEVRRKYGQS